MPADQSQLQELRAAVSRAPQDVELRLRYAEHLLSIDRPQDAWHQCACVLYDLPYNQGALETARRAAAACGVLYRADEYAGRLEAVRSGRAWRPAGSKTATPEKTYRVQGRKLRLIRGGRVKD